MVVRIISGAIWGVDAYRIDVEVCLIQGLPNVFVIGLPDGAVKEARMRIEASIRALGITMPNKRITFSLAPSDRKKAGSSFDLPMAVGLLESMEIIPPGSTQKTAFSGELGLDGSLRPVRGVLSLARLARLQGCRAIVVPLHNASEAAVVQGIDVFGANTLQEVILHLKGESPIQKNAAPDAKLEPHDTDIDLLDVRGQPVARRALELAAAGGHHLIYLGPPGTGKSMLARRLPGLLPPMNLEEALSVTQIYSAAGLLGDRSLIETRPFRAPHHTATEVALIGGGHHQVRVGELSLAHMGVLFLDEATEFPRSVLDSLREPIENGEVDICRAAHRVRLPARSQMVIALNPCPCGYKGQERNGRTCNCSPHLADRYLKRLSGPLLDRMDIQLELDPVPLHLLQAPPDGESSATVRERVAIARKKQAERLPKGKRPQLNAWMNAQETRRFCSLDPDAQRVISLKAEQKGLSARGLDRVLRVARTAADLEGATSIRVKDVYEALSYRSLEQLIRGGQEIDSFSRRPKANNSLKQLLNLPKIRKHKPRTQSLFADNDDGETESSNIQKEDIDN